jgi:hypothetical protein
MLRGLRPSEVLLIVGWLVVGYRRFGTVDWSHLQGSSGQPINASQEPEVRRRHLHHGVSLKSLPVIIDFNVRSHVRVDCCVRGLYVGRRRVGRSFLLHKCRYKHDDAKLNMIISSRMTYCSICNVD